MAFARNIVTLHMHVACQQARLGRLLHNTHQSTKSYSDAAFRQCRQEDIDLVERNRGWIRSAFGPDGEEQARKMIKSIMQYDLHYHMKLVDVLYQRNVDRRIIFKTCFSRILDEKHYNYIVSLIDHLGEEYALRLFSSYR